MPDQNLSSLPTSTLSFQITESIVNLFAELTQDYSALHTNEEFARRSIYRTKVVHGMLPVLFLAGLDLFKKDAPLKTMTQFQVKFLKPVFLTSSLNLSATPSANTDAHLTTYDFQITHTISGSLVTTGQLTLKAAETAEISTSTSAPTHGMLFDQLTENTYRLTELNKGMYCQWPFAVGPEAFAALQQILKLGTSEKCDLISTGHPFGIQLLASLLTSTVAGMGLSGRYATFLDLQLHWHSKMKTNHHYLLQATVGFKSDPLGVLVNDVVIVSQADPQQPCASGKMTVKVNAPTPLTPMMKDLKESVSDIDFKDRVVLITGASRGIGATAAKLFAAHGAKVIVNYFRGTADAKAIVEDIQTSGAEAIALAANVANPAEVKQLIKQAIEHFGKIDILINNAVKDARPIPFADLSWEDIQQEIDVTVKGAFHCSKEVLPVFLNQGQGTIINMGTIYIDNPVPQQAKYVIAKNALLGLTRSLAVDFANRNIRILMISPRMVDTDLSQGGRDTKPKLSTVEVAQKMVEAAAWPVNYKSGEVITIN